MTTAPWSNTPRPTPGGTRLQWGIRIPMRDGIHLSGTLYLPAELSTAAPAIFTLTPYVAQASHEIATYFAGHGYPFLTIDVRGRGNSEGTFKANGNEARDGHDIVEWLAPQTYCNGKVAMWGGSYSGYVQWSTAREFPPHLASIVPVASPFRGVDSPAPNNIFPPYRVQWLTHLAGHTSQDKIFGDQRFWSQQFRRWFESGTPFRQLDSFLGSPSPIFQEWMSHPHLDDYWDSYNPTAEHYARIDLPVLTITGTYDGNQRGALMHYREHMKHASSVARARHYLVIGPWDHAGTRVPKAEFGGITVAAAAVLDLAELHRQWFAWTMQDGARPALLRDRVAYYVMGADEWRYASTLEEIAAGTLPLYLQSNGDATDVFASGALTESPPQRCEPDNYVYDPRDISLAELESSVDPGDWTDQRMVYAAVGKQLVYHSAPFRHDIEISGFFKLSVWLAIDQPDTDFRVTVYEVRLDGSAIQLSSDSLRARYRDSLRAPTLVETKLPLRYDFERFTFVARRVPKRHRLRLVIGPINSIYWQKNYNSGGVVADETLQDARTVSVGLFHDEEHPSALYVPLGRTGP